MASKYHDDWQSSKKTVLERNRYMFDNELMSDIAFTCGDSSRVFHAHKYVLATSSAVFYAMFYGDLAQKESTINLADADEEGFQDFLRFLYTDECKITAENGVQILYLAKKYLVSSLAKKCCEVLKTSVKPENVFVLLEQAMQFDEKELEEKCWRIISEKTLESINSEGFTNIKSDTLNALLKRDIWTTTEVELFQGVLKWVDKECARQGINIEDDNTARRRVLGDSVYEIQFLEMSQQDFAKYVIPSRILTDAELLSFFQKFSGLKVSGFKWKERGYRRRSYIVRSFSRFDLSQQFGMGWGYAGSTDGLTLSFNKAVRFHGARLFGDSSGSQYEVTFKIKDESLTRTYTSEQDDNGVWGYDVMLTKPVSLLPGEKCTIFATIKGPESYYGENGKLSVQVDNIVVTFDKAKFEPGVTSNDTNIIYGQFYKMFLSRQ